MDSCLGCGALEIETVLRDHGEMFCPKCGEYTPTERELEGKPALEESGMFEDAIQGEFEKIEDAARSAKQIIERALKINTPLGIGVEIVNHLDGMIKVSRDVWRSLLPAPDEDEDDGEPA